MRCQKSCLYARKAEVGPKPKPKEESQKMFLCSKRAQRQNKKIKRKRHSEMDLKFLNLTSFRGNRLFPEFILIPLLT